MSTIQTRLEKLEKSARTQDGQRFIFTWQMDESTSAVVCEGVRCERLPGESLEDLQFRAATAAWDKREREGRPAPAGHDILWVSEAWD